MNKKLRAFLEASGQQSFSQSFWEEIAIYDAITPIKRREVLIPYGSRPKCGYFIVSGGFSTSMISDSGDKKALWFNLDVQFPMVICPDSYFLNEPTKYEVTALENSEVIKINKQHVDQLAEKYKSFGQFYFRDVVTNCITINEIRNYMLSHTPLQFLDYIKKNYPAYFDRLSSKNMAHFLGISPEWYSKLKKKS